MDKDFGDLKFESNGGSSSFTVSVTGDCEGDKTITYTTEGNLTNWATVDYSNSTFTITCKGENKTTSKYKGALILKIGNDTCTSDKINCEQAAVSCVEDSCTCYIVGAVTYPSSSNTQATVEWSYSAITWTTASTCDVTSALTATNTSSTTVTYNPASCDKWTQSGTITWTGYKACGNKSCSSSDVTLSWSVNQGKPAGCDCNCTDITASTNSINWAVNDDTHKSVVITFGTCINIGNISLTGTDKAHFDFSTASTASNKITVEVWPKETGLVNEKTASLSIPYGTGGTSTNCATKTVSLTHNGSGCSCEDLFPNIDTYNFDFDEYGVDKAQTITFALATGKDDCVTISSLSIRTDGDTDYFTVDESKLATEHKVKVYPNFENDDRDTTYQLWVYYEFELSDGTTTCGEDDEYYVYFEQEPTDECKDCGLIHALGLDPVLLYPKIANTYEFATGKTTVCGDFRTQSRSGTAKWKIREDGMKRYFDVTFPKTVENDEVSDLRLWFDYSDGSTPACYEDFKFVQTDCNCIALEKLTFDSEYVNNRLPRTAIQGIKIFSVRKDSYKQYCTDFDITVQMPPGLNWLTDVGLDTNTEIYDYITGNTTENTDTDERPATIIIQPRANYNGQTFNCKSKSFGIYQNGLDCSCGEPETDTKVVEGKRADSGFIFSKKYYDPSCFPENFTPDKYFTITYEGDMFTEFESHPYENNGLYKAYCTYDVSANPDPNNPRYGYVTIKINLAGDNNCETLYTIKQSKGAEDTCLTAMMYVNDAFYSSYKGGRKEIAHYYGGNDYTIALRDQSDLPSWIEDESVSNIDERGVENKNYLYATFKPNSGATGTLPDGTDAPSNADEMYKTKDPREKNIRVYLIKEDGTPCEENKTIKIGQDGWSGSCGCDGIINYTQEECGEIVPPTQEHPQEYHGFHYDGSNAQVLCYFNLDDAESCNSIVATPQDKSYFNGNLTVESASKEISGVVYKNCVKGVIASHTGWEIDEPVAIVLRLMRNIGGTNTEECKTESFSILIFKD